MLDVILKFLQTNNVKSPKGKLDLDDFKELCKTGSYVGIAAGLAYIVANVASVNFDSDGSQGWTTIMVPIITVAFTALSRLISGQVEDKTDEKQTK